MAQVEYLIDLQWHKKGDQAFLDDASAADQAEEGVVKILDDDAAKPSAKRSTKPKQ